jgi:hypothetical protein
VRPARKIYICEPSRSLAQEFRELPKDGHRILGSEYTAHPFSLLKKSRRSSKIIKNKEEQKEKRKAILTQKSLGLRFEARHNVSFPLDLLGLFVAQSIICDLNPLAKIFDISSVFLSFFTSCLAGFELGLQIVGAFLGTAKCM